jgi:hypothetical protein
MNASRSQPVRNESLITKRVRRFIQVFTRYQWEPTGENYAACFNAFLDALPDLDLRTVAAIGVNVKVWRRVLGERIDELRREEARNKRKDSCDSKPSV